MVQGIVAVSAEAGAGASNDPAMAFLVDRADSPVDRADRPAGGFADQAGSPVAIVAEDSLVGRVDFPAAPGAVIAAVIAAEVGGLALQRAARSRPKIGLPDSRACSAGSTRTVTVPSTLGKSLRTGGAF